MTQVVNTFQEHKEEIGLFYDFLNEVVEHEARLLLPQPAENVKKIKLETIAIMKASFFMMLYDCVESTIVNCLNTIIRTIMSEECKYSDFTDELQMAILAAYEYRLSECGTKDQRSKVLKQQADFLIGIAPAYIDIKSLVGSSSQGTFAGSLDSKEIKKLFLRIGVELNELTCSELQKIKECRNKLAHGECSFQEYGRNLTIQYLGVSMEKTLTYLDALINKISDFIDKEKYKKRTAVIKKTSTLSLIVDCLLGRNKKST